MADWQAFGEDNCRIFSPFYHHNKFSASCEDINSPTLYSNCIEAADSQNWTAQASELCLATEGCHWNQFSVLTNSLCTNCPAICRSVHKSLNIVQFSVGAALYVLAVPISDICYLNIMTNNLRKNEQVNQINSYSEFLGS